MGRGSPTRETLDRETVGDEVIEGHTVDVPGVEWNLTE